MKLVTVSFPFPLVQIYTTSLFVWIFTLPFALVEKYDDIPILIVIIFFLTFDFIGLKIEIIELDNPFGEDHNGN